MEPASVLSAASKKASPIGLAFLCYGSILLPSG